jgi:hypothetical protein
MWPTPSLAWSRPVQRVPVRSRTVTEGIAMGWKYDYKDKDDRKKDHDDYKKNHDDNDYDKKDHGDDKHGKDKKRRHKD